MKIVEESKQEDIWNRTPGESDKPGLKHIIITITLILLGSIVGGFGSISFPLDYGVNYFWLGIVIQQVGSIWFGAWGVIAGVIFPFFSNAVTGTPFLVSLAYVPANFIQSYLVALVFRRYKLDPDLKTGADYLYMFLAMLVSSFFGAIWSVVIVLNGFDLLIGESMLRYIWGWFGGNFIAGVVFNFVLLKILSKNEVLTKLFVRKWWS